MKRDHDPEIAAQLDAYRVEEADRQLLDNIVRKTVGTPQKTRQFPSSLYFLGSKTPIWKAQAAAYASLAFFGFWIGSETPTVSSMPSTQPQVYSENNDLSGIVFGPTTWKEVNL